MENIDIYFKDIRKKHPFSLEEEIQLAVRIQQGDARALNKLVEGNLRFVVTEARRHIGRGMDLEDLIQEGNIGLIEAAKRFDPEAGFRFITYAVYWIRQAIFTALSVNRTVRLPMNVVGSVNRINRAADLFRLTEGREPSDTEIAEITGIELEEVRTVFQASTRATSLSKPVGNTEEDGCLADLIEDVDVKSTDSIVFGEGLVTDLLRTLHSVLSQKECNIVAKSFGIGCVALTEEQVGKEIGISPERVRQLREASVKKLRKNGKVVATLLEYLG